MAQALFNDHPIEHYLRESGDVPELMPGGAHEFAIQSELNCPSEDIPYRPSPVPIWLKRPLEMVQYLLECVAPRKPTAISQFAERFKYLVISSSLLSSSLSSLSSPVFDRAITPTTPGHYDHSPPPFTTPMVANTVSHVTPADMLAYSLACLVPVALARGSYISGIFLAAAVWILTGIEAESVDQEPETWSKTLETLEALILANEVWDSVISESFRILESDEQFDSHRIELSSPIHHIRSTLSSSLHTIQTQCDDVRQLLEALTSPLVLCQLTHMYAPPLPSRLSPPSTASLSPSPRPRPVSLTVPFQLSRPSSTLNSDFEDPYTRSRTQSQPSSADKRATWNGTYLPLSRRSSKRRSNLSSLIDDDAVKSQSTKIISSAPSTPTIREVRDISEDDAEPFGVTALELRRRRNSRFSSTLQNPILTSSIGSRYTSLTPPSSTNSPQSLHTALQGAMGAKRFACAHLLALRFDDTTDSNCWINGPDLDADEAYWENVRSVIIILTSAFEDASSRLGDVLQQLRRERDQQRVEERPNDEEVSVSAFAQLHPTSFAPVPGHLTRFLGHVDAISTALDDARMHLQQCLAILREDPDFDRPDSEDHDALQSYDRLRRELGLALRECERGKEPLRNIVERQKSHIAAEENEVFVRDDKVEAAGLNGGIHHDEQFSSGESDKTLFNVEEEQITKAEEADYPNDDATGHLLSITTVQHLPPPGIEQVFEADSIAVPFTRPRSTLTREERIALSRARRESQGGRVSIGVREKDSGETEKFHGLGPGEEVVEELKDVIWKVSEQRQRMSTRAPSLDPNTLSFIVP